MADRYFVNSFNTKKIQTVYMRRNEERIVFIGSQIHRPIDISNPKQIIKTGVGSIVFDVNKYSKMMFVHQALREVLINKEKEWTVLLCTKGYTQIQINTIKKYFNNILKEDGSQTVRYIKEISNLNEILYYINRGDKKTNRSLYMISKLIFYCHGDVRGLSPWMTSIPKNSDPYIDKNFVKNIEKYAFDPSSEIYSYACRTGLGNKNINQDGTGMNPMMNNSVAQALANATGAVVYAYLRRTSYEDTLLNIDERKFIDAVHFYIKKDRTQREYNGYNELKNKSELSDKELERFNFLDSI